MDKLKRLLRLSSERGGLGDTELDQLVQEVSSSDVDRLFSILESHAESQRMRGDAIFLALTLAEAGNAQATMKLEQLATDSKDPQVQVVAVAFVESKRKRSAESVPENVIAFRRRGGE